MTRVQTADRRLVAEPDARPHDQDVRGEHFLENRGPLVAVPPMPPHVRVDARGDIEVDRSQELDPYTVLLHDRARDADQVFGVRELWAVLERTVEEDGRETGKVLAAGGAQALLRLIEHRDTGSSP